MTMEQYLNEHSAHEGAEDSGPILCEYCGEEITGQLFTDGEINLHPECALEYVEEQLSDLEIVEHCGFWSLG